MAIDNFGFLGKEIELHKKQIAEKYADLLIIYRELNHILHKSKFNLKIDVNDAQKFAIVGLFIKAHETFQSIYILATQGLTADAENLNRILFEATVNLLYCSKGDTYFKRYMARDLNKLIMWIDNALKKPEEQPEELFRRGSLEGRKGEYQAMLKKIKEEMKSGYIPSIKEMAKELGMVKSYHTFYRVASDNVHTSPGSLDEYFILDEKKDIKGFKWGPRIEDVEIQLFTALNFMFHISRCLSVIFGEPQEKDLNILWGKISDYFSRIQKAKG